MGAFFKGLGMALFAAVAAAACGGDDNGNGGVNSGVDSAKPADQLSAADAKKVCDAIASYAKTQLSDLLRRTLCVSLTAAPALAGNAPTIAECNDSVDKCLMQTMPPPMPPGSAGCTVSGTVTPGCKATVAEIQACGTAAIDSARTILEGVSCDLWGLPPADAQQKIRDAQNRPQPAECVVVQQKCATPVSTGQTPNPAPTAG